MLGRTTISDYDHFRTWTAIDDADELQILCQHTHPGCAYPSLDIEYHQAVFRGGGFEVLIKSLFGEAVPAPDTGNNLLDHLGDVVRSNLSCSSGAMSIATRNACKEDGLATSLPTPGDVYTSWVNSFQFAPSPMFGSSLEIGF